MADLIQQVDYWHWWIFAGILLLIEVLAPSFYFLWLSIAAALTGLILLGLPALGWQYQLLFFSGLSVVSIVLFRRYQRHNPSATDQPALNRRGEQYVGRTFTLDQPVVNRVGKLRIDDSTWRITGDDLPAGTHVKVTGVDGVVLKIAPATD